MWVVALQGLVVASFEDMTLVIMVVEEELVSILQMRVLLSIALDILRLIVRVDVALVL